jgi:predicted alpha/beta-hydrolase family hydrolase
VAERPLKIGTPRGETSAIVSGPESGPLVVLAHGAGHDMNQPLLAGFAEALGEAAIGCLRFNFLYKEQGRKAPDREPVLRAAWEAAFGQGAELGGPVWAAGKSLGGRIASMMVADGLPAEGLVFLGYPLHPPGKPDRIRDKHLARVKMPMLFVQGTADPFARWDLIEATVAGLGGRATLHPVEGGDHSFRVRRASKSGDETGRILGKVAAGFINSKR